ncbi:efflux RND transporter periplasmic adaptor subunit [Deinococcus sp.]|uniref:efflux RND transporter periplasmic adaptor subunit n=1 Tax=Deinococcus sp. TaxID=47478 RepID=UPI003CC56076
MDQASRQPNADPPIPKAAALPGPRGRPRRWSWLAIPLLIAAAGYGGYLIGKPSASSVAGTQAGGFAGAGGSGAAGMGRGGFGAGGAGRGGSGATTPVQATAVRSGTLSTQRSATGTVSALQQSSVPARTSGTVSSLLAQVGDNVKAGQTVVQLDNTDLTSAVQSAQNALDTARVQLSTQTETVSGNRAQLQQALASAQAAYDSAQASYAADQKLYAIGGIAKTALDSASSQVQQALSNVTSAQNAVNQNNSAQNGSLLQLRLAVQKAQITLRQSQQALSSARVVAPFDGTISAIPVAGGEYLNAGASAFTLVSSGRQVTFSVPPAEGAAFTDGRAVTFSVGQQRYPLKITQNAGAPTNGNVALTARFVGSSVPALGTAGAVTYSSVVGKGILIPNTALQADNNQTYVFTMVGGKAKLQDVTVIGQAGTQAVVSGLADGAQVITTPPSGLLDGAKVTTDAAGAQAAGSGRGGAGQGGTGQAQGGSESSAQPGQTPTGQVTSGQSGATPGQGRYRRQGAQTGTAAQNGSATQGAASQSAPTVPATPTAPASSTPAGAP